MIPPLNPMAPSVHRSSLPMAGLRQHLAPSKNLALTQPDDELVQSFLQGNQDAFEELMMRYTARVFSLATRLTKNREDAEEVLQDVFSAAYRKLKDFKGESTFSSWIYRITVNASFMKLRKGRQKRGTVQLDEVSREAEEKMQSEPHAEVTVEHQAVAQEVSIHLEAAIADLPEDYRPVFVLRDVDGLNNREVSEILDMTIPAIKSRLHRSRLMLRRKLRGYYRSYCGNDVEKRHGNDG